MYSTFLAVDKRQRKCQGRWLIAVAVFAYPLRGKRCQRAASHHEHALGRHHPKANTFSCTKRRPAFGSLGDRGLERISVPTGPDARRSGRFICRPRRVASSQQAAGDCRQMEDSHERREWEIRGGAGVWLYILKDKEIRTGAANSAARALLRKSRKRK